MVSAVSGSARISARSSGVGPRKLRAAVKNIGSAHLMQTQTSPSEGRGASGVARLSAASTSLPQLRQRRAGKRWLSGMAGRSKVVDEAVAAAAIALEDIVEIEALEPAVRADE